LKRVRFSRRAELDLLDIGDWIAHDRPRAARRFVEALIARSSELSINPELGPLLPAYGDHVRGLGLKPYIILYRVAGEDVFVERVIHGARSPKNIA